MTETEVEVQISLLPPPPEGVEWTTRSLAIVDPNFSLEQFEQLLRAAGDFKTAASFWIGDLIAFGERRYGERYAQALEATGLSYSTLSNYVSVCGKVAPERRRPSLRFSHHAEVASLPPAEQDRWLGNAETNGWTREQLRDAIRDAGRMAPTPISPGPQPASSSRRQEVLDPVAVVEAGRELNVVHEVLTKTRDALEGATVEGLEEMLPSAFRAVEELGQTVRVAAAKMAAPTLVEAARALEKAATHSGGFAMIPDADFQSFLAAVDRESA